MSSTRSGASTRAAVRRLAITFAALLMFTLPCGADEPSQPASQAVEPDTLTPPVAKVRLDDIIVLGDYENLIGQAAAASQGVALQSDIQARPYLRAGEVLELVPGMIVTQHSGTGKANQYFLRGFNLDHGTDFAATVEGVPMNLPTHAHGHGYLDLNFVIPELVERVNYRKGPYYAAVGDFGSAGSADIMLANRLPRGFLSIGVGKDLYGRTLFAMSPKVGDGYLLTAFEAQYYDGPWVEGEHLGKFNGVVKYTLDDVDSGATFGFMGYHAKWDSTDQVPSRAVDSGMIDRLGVIDDTVGGRTSRFTGYANLWAETGWGHTTVNAYAAYYALNLFSNFTYFLDDPADGDQFEQEDRRYIFGGDVAHEWDADLFGLDMAHTVGLQLRNDYIDNIGLYRTSAQQRLSTVRQDTVNQFSAGLYYENHIRWHEKVRTILGLRGDVYHFDVDSVLEANSGTASDAIVSPKASVVLGPWNRIEIYGNWGMGFHSNDARGATITIDPATGDPASKVDSLVRSHGAELGVRSNALIPEWTTSVTAWWLALDSELLFVGDAGTTEASRPSRRIGVEWVNLYKPTDELTFDVTFTHTHARFTDDDPAGDEIPGTIRNTVAAGASLDLPNGLFTSLRLRYFGPRPLIEDGSVESDSTTLLNWRLGYEADDWIATVDVLNLLNSRDHDIDYFYESRLPGEPAGGVSDIHYHPVEPLTVRFYVTIKF